MDRLMLVPDRDACRANVNVSIGFFAAVVGE
jgi:hypothetical protein